jgi:hypothetical protein
MTIQIWKSAIGVLPCMFNEWGAYTIFTALAGNRVPSSIFLPCNTGCSAFLYITGEATPKVLNGGKIA